MANSLYKVLNVDIVATEPEIESAYFRELSKIRKGDERSCRKLISAYHILRNSGTRYVYDKLGDCILSPIEDSRNHEVITGIISPAGWLVLCFLYQSVFHAVLVSQPLAATRSILEYLGKPIPLYLSYPILFLPAVAAILLMTIFFVISAAAMKGRLSTDIAFNVFLRSAIRSALLALSVVMTLVITEWNGGSRIVKLLPLIPWLMLSASFVLIPFKRSKRFDFSRLSALIPISVTSFALPLSIILTLHPTISFLIYVLSVISFVAFLDVELGLSVVVYAIAFPVLFGLELIYGVNLKPSFWRASFYVLLHLVSAGLVFSLRFSIPSIVSSSLKGLIRDDGDDDENGGDSDAEWVEKPGVAPKMPVVEPVTSGSSNPPNSSDEAVSKDVGGTDSEKCSDPGQLSEQRKADSDGLDSDDRYEKENIETVADGEGAGRVGDINITPNTVA